MDESVENKNGNGVKKTKPVVMSREDVLELLLVNEKQRRIKAEEARLQSELSAVQVESSTLAQKLANKYGVDLNGVRVESDGRVLHGETGEPIRVPVE